VNFIKKIFGLEPALKRTPEVQASLERIEARKQKEMKQAEEQRRRERVLKTQMPADQIGKQQGVSAEEELRRLERKAQQPHKDRLQADSGIMANSKMDLWLNTISPEDPPDTIAPHMRIPDTVFNVETNKFGK
jgi:hypothetical protein